MKRILKWKIWCITCLVCLAPIVFGIAVYDQLPASIAVHFNISNQPDRFASKAFVVFGLPALMAVLQTVCCIIFDINEKKHGTRKKFERATKWIIPSLSVLLQAVTLLYALQVSLDIRKIVVVLVGIIFIILGNYLPKFDDVQGKNMDIEKTQKVNRVLGYAMVFMGVLAIATAFLPPITSVIWLFLLIPYALFGTIYTMRIIRK